MANPEANEKVILRQIVDGVGLYQAVPQAPGGQLLYAVMAGQVAALDSLSLQEAWADQSGLFLFLPNQAVLGDPAALHRALAAYLADQAIPYRQWIGWLPSADPDAVPLLNYITVNKPAGDVEGRVSVSGDAPAAISFLNLQLQMSIQVRVVPQLDGPTPALILMADSASRASINLAQPASGAALNIADDSPTRIALSGAECGTLAFALNGDAGNFYDLFTDISASDPDPVPAGAEVRFVTAQGQELRFPFLSGAVPRSLPKPQTNLPLRVQIDPLAPTDSGRTRFAYDLQHFGGPQQPPIPMSDVGRSNLGATLALTAVDGAGFGLGLRRGEQGEPMGYLTPAGPFVVTRAGDAKVAGPPIAQDAVQMLCGVYGSEFLLLAEEDRVEFVGTRAATAAFQQEGASSLSERTTTAWAKIVPGERAKATFPGPIAQSYCAQASGANYFRSGAEEGATLPIVLGARIADLSVAGSAQHFPIAMYGMVFETGPHDDRFNPNPAADADMLSAFEASCLSRARFDLLEPDRLLGPIFFDMASMETLSGGFVRTPSGLVVALNDGAMDGPTPSGSWAQIILARSLNNQAQLLSFKPKVSSPVQVVDPALSTALLNPAANLFIASDVHLGDFDNQIALGEFPIRIAVSASDERGGDDNPLGRNCVLICKFSTDIALSVLAGKTDRWTATDDLTGTAATVSRLSGQVQRYLAKAREESAAAREAGQFDYFADFLERIDDPSWAGIIALNPPLDQQSLPPDIQMLLCGMRGGDGLRCHHFGIDANSIPSIKNNAEIIDNSSLFGLVHYSSAFQAARVGSPFDFQTLRLNALFGSSVLKHFDAQIAVSVETILGNPAVLSEAAPSDRPDTNTIIIDGVLQQVDGMTRVTFETDAARAFTMRTKRDVFRALARQQVTRAALAPLLRENGEEDRLPAEGLAVVADFTLDGAFGFNSKQISAGAEVDLFSYALDDEGEGGLPYSGYALRMESFVPQIGPTLPPKMSLALDAVSVAATNADPREGSLAATLPLKVTRFVSSIPAAAKCAQVSGTGIDAVRPTYALGAELVMGSLGDLSESGPLQGQLLLGWVPGGAEDRPDKIGVLLAPPGAMEGGGFRLQGVIGAKYGQVEIIKSELDKKDIYVLIINDVQFLIGSFQLFPASQTRSITFFGLPADDADDPHDSMRDEATAGVTLSWFLGKPDLEGGGALRRMSPPHSEGGPDVELDYEVSVAVLAGVRVEYDREATGIVDEVLSSLLEVPESTKEALDKILSGDVSLPVVYDPDAGISVGVDLTFGPVAFKFVFSDPNVYGGSIAISVDDDDDDDEREDEVGRSGSGQADWDAERRLPKLRDDPDPEKKKGILNSLDGFALEVAYRKISAGLGAWSARLDTGQRIGTDDYYLQLPTVGVVIYTNGDFRVDIGWPYDIREEDCTPIAVQFAVEGVPVRASAGLYLAKLRSADAPEIFGDLFALIWRFGLGLGIGVEKEIEKGPLTLSAGMSAFLTFEGFLASKSGHMTQDGVDHKWFAGQLGARAHFSGSVDLDIIYIGVSAEAMLVLQVAYETDHATVIDVVFSLSLSFEFRILFIKISFSFSVECNLIPTIRIGAGPPASIDGPDPLGARMLVREEAPQLRVKQIDASLLHAGNVRTVGSDRIVIPLTLVMQPGVSNDADGGVAPFAVATLMINLEPAGAQSDDFSRFATLLAGWLDTGWGGAGALAKRLATIAEALAGQKVDGQVEPFLQASFQFRIVADDGLSASKNYAAFPMLGALILEYDGKIVDFGSPPVPAGYAEALRSYFMTLAPQLRSRSRRVGVQAAALPSATSLICTDMIIVMAKQLIAQLRDVVEKSPAITSLEEALAALGPQGFANVAGICSRFAFHGVRLPSPEATPFGSEMLGLYALTRQQIALRQTDGSYDGRFTLRSAPGSAWIAFGADGQADSATATLDPSLVLTSKVRPGWLAGRGLQPKPPLHAETAVFYLQQPIQCDIAGGDQSFLPFNDSLARRLASFAWRAGDAVRGDVRHVTAKQARSVAQLLRNSDGLRASSALLVPIRLRQIVPDGATLPLSDVFELIGTDDATRALLEKMIRGDAEGTLLSLLITNSGASYSEVQHPASVVLAKANLSTLNEPPSLRAAAAAPAVSPDSARLRDVPQFLTLLWEASVTHSGGFFVHIGDLAPDLFENGSIAAALLVRGEMAENPLLAPWCNGVVVDGSGGQLAAKEGAMTLSVSDGSGPWCDVRPNHAAGVAGFDLIWPVPDSMPALDAQPTDAQKQAYATSLYSLLQYRVESMSLSEGTGLAAQPLPSNWSQPVGPHDHEGGVDWKFSGTVAAAAVLGAENPYAAVGTRVCFGVATLDIYGNRLPDLHHEESIIVYNDPLLGLDQWPAVLGYYAFARSAADHVALKLHLDFDPSRLNSGEAGAEDPAVLRTAYSGAQAVLAQLRDPLQCQQADAGISVETAFSDAPLRFDSEGARLTERVAGWIAAIADWLHDAADGRTIEPPPPLSLEFLLPISAAAKLSDDLTPLQLQLVHSRNPDTVTAEVRSALPTSVRSASPLAAAADLNSATLKAGTAPDLSLGAFTQSFEKAWFGFDGADAQLKLAQGHDAQGTSPAGLWCVRVGKGAGVDVRFPNASGPDPNGLPVTYALPPLSSQLLSRSCEVRNYREVWKGDGSDVLLPDNVVAFVDIDLDQWASTCLASFDHMFAPELATAIAAVDPAGYAALSDSKARLAETIAQNLLPVLQIPGQACDPANARERFRQALLQSLAGAYAMSAVVDLPATVARAGDGHASAPPNLYAAPMGPGLDRSVTGQAFTLSPAKLALGQGASSLAYLVAARSASRQAWLDVPLTYHVGQIEHAIDPTRALFGYTPSAWLALLAPDFIPEHGAEAAFHFDLGRNAIPLPLRAYPQMPSILVQKAEAAEGATSIGDALRWTYSCKVTSPQAAQDSLALCIRLNDPATPVASRVQPRALEGGAGEDPARPLPKDLFEALARCTHEMPQITAHFDTISKAAFEDGDMPVAKAAIRRAQLLIDGVEGCWRSWRNPSLARGSRIASSEVAPAVEAVQWHYQIDFSRLPDLLLTRAASVEAVLPPWPELDGFETPKETGRSALYRSLGHGKDDGSIDLSLPDLPITAAQSAWVRAHIIRNANLVPPGMPAGTRVNPAFIYQTPDVQAPGPVWILNSSSREIEVGKTAATLSEAIDALLAPLAAHAFFGGLIAREVQVELGASYCFELVKSPVPPNMVVQRAIFLSMTGLATDCVDGRGKAIGEFRDEIVATLCAAIDADARTGRNECFSLSLTLFSSIRNAAAPVLRLGSLMIRIPERGRDWWR